MVVTCSNYSGKMDFSEVALLFNSAIKQGTAKTGMNIFSYEGSLREFCVRAASPMLGVLISAGMLQFLDDLEEAVREGKRRVGK